MYFGCRDRKGKNKNKTARKVTRKEFANNARCTSTSAWYAFRIAPDANGAEKTRITTGPFFHPFSVPSELSWKAWRKASSGAPNTPSQPQWVSFSRPSYRPFAVELVLPSRCCIKNVVVASKKEEGKMMSSITKKVLSFYYLLRGISLFGGRDAAACCNNPQHSFGGGGIKALVRLACALYAWYDICRASAFLCPSCCTTDYTSFLMRSDPQDPKRVVFVGFSAAFCLSFWACLFFER